MSKLINAVRCTDEESGCSYPVPHQHGSTCDWACLCGRGYHPEPLPAARHMSLMAPPRRGWLARIFGGKR